MTANLTNAFNTEDIDNAVRALVDPGHKLGLPTPFIFGALTVYDAGGKLGGNNEKTLIAAGYVTKALTLTDNGRSLLDLCTQRGDTPFLWAKDMAAAAIRKTAQPAPVAA